MVKMGRKLHWRMLVLGTAGATCLGACADAPTSPGNSPGRDVGVSRAAQVELAAAAHGRTSRGVEDEILRIENAIPGVGGMFRDAAGNINIYVPHGANAGLIKAALARVAPGLGLPQSARDELADGRTVKLIEGDYAFSQLVAWEQAIATKLQPGTGIFGVDADEAKNRVRILVTHDVDAAKVQQLAVAAGVPAAAVVVEVGTPPSQLNSIRGTFRPTAGGVQWSTSDGYTTSTCTIGFNVTTGDLTYGFLTASHCALGPMGSGQTGGTAYQPIPNSSVGFIRWNPAWNSTDPNCGGYTLCVYADVLYVQYTDPSISSKMVVYTNNAGFNNAGGSITATGYWRNIAAPLATTPMVGDPLDKMGRTTGWTRGTFVASCQDIADPVANSMHLCSDQITNSRAGEGDSGGPIFIPPPPGQVSQPLTPVGILWGGSPANHYDSADGLYYCDGTAGPCQIYYSNWARAQTAMTSPFYPY